MHPLWGNKEAGMIPDAKLREMIDELVLTKDSDPEFAEGLMWIDQYVQENGEDFYEVVIRKTRKHMAEKGAREWLEKR